MAIPDRSTFESAYAGNAPWDIGKPQPALVDAANDIRGSLLDAGCGTGENALFFASRGHKVTGIDYLAAPIELARQKAAQRKLSATFLVMDALKLHDLPEVFETVIDCGLFHVFSDQDRQRYVEGLSSLLIPGGRLHLLCFSNEEPGDLGPRRVSREDLQNAFTEGWALERITPIRFEVRPDLPAGTFSIGGPRAWHAVIQRSE